MTDWYKIKRILIWQNNQEKQIYPAGLQLKLKFDFSVDNSFGDYTYTNTWWGGLVIQNNNWWVTNYGSHWNWFVWKTVNAKEIWTRILRNMADVSISWNNGWWLWLWVFAWHWWIPSNAWYAVSQACYNSSKTSVIGYKWVDVVTEISNVNLWTDYYMDFKFKDWIYTLEILDTNLNVIKTSSYKTSDTVCNYVWFCLWNYWQNNFCRVKKYREAYEV